MAAPHRMLPDVTIGWWTYAKYLLSQLLIRVGVWSRLKKLGKVRAEARQPTPIPVTDNDSFYFSGANKDGVQIFLRLAFRRDVPTERWLGLTGLPGMKEGEMYVHDSPPIAADKAREHGIASGALEFECVEPLQRWKVAFDGTCDLVGAKKKTQHHIRLDLECNMDSPVFDFDVDLSVHPLAESMALAPWNAAYFPTFKKAHQSHYEQNGILSGTCCVDGGASTAIADVKGMRDHSFGARDWSYMHRWCVLFGTLDDGRYFHSIFVRHPLSARITCGYLYSKEDGFTAIEDGCCEAIWQDGLPPAFFEFSFKPEGKAWIDASCTVRGEPTNPRFLVGPRQEAVLYERFAHYTIGGVHGYGISEFQYGDSTNHRA